MDLLPSFLIVFLVLSNPPPPSLFLWCVKGGGVAVGTGFNQVGQAVVQFTGKRLVRDGKG